MKKIYLTIFFIIGLFSFSFLNVKNIHAAAVSWDAGAGTANWSDALNWSNDAVPTAADDVTIATATTVNIAATTTINSLTLGVVGGGTASVLNFSYDAITNGALIIDAGDLTVYSGASITHSAGTTVVVGTVNIDVQTGNATVTGSINISAKGYQPYSGTGVGGLTAGGGHGGTGSNGSGGVGGISYGSITNPTTLGSPGGRQSGSNGGPGIGGGAAKLNVAGTLAVNGSINANAGATTSCWSAGGGAGGSLNISANTISGTTGSITANGTTGCNASSGQGGGGRIALFYTTLSFSGTLTAYGIGTSGAGTIYKKPTAQTYGNLLIDNNNLISVKDYGMGETPLSGTYTFDTITLQNYGKADITATSNITYTTLDWATKGIIADNGGTFSLVSGGGSLTIPSTAYLYGNTTRSFTDLTVNGILTHSQNTTAETYKVDYTVSGNTTINSGGSINVDKVGFNGGEGTGQGVDSSTGAGGAGYGGSGGNGSVGAGGSTYGSQESPTNLGSGGGVSSVVALSGGGAVKLNVTGTTTVSGTISANGESHSNAWQPGGGSGGSIYLITGNFAGSTGVIRANGGDGRLTGGGGGGGRIAIHFSGTNTYTGTTTVTGGTGNASGNSGTIYTNGLPSVNSLAQYRSDGTTSIATGGNSNTTTVVLIMSMSDADGSDTLTPYVEVQPIGTPFTDSGTSGTPVAYSGTPVTGSVTVSGLIDATSYHWQAKVCDATSVCTAWSSYGGNAESATDFAVVVNGLPSMNTLSQYQSDGTTSIATGGTSTTTTVVLKMSMSDADASDTLTPYVEAQPIGTSFTNSGTAGTPVAYSGSPVTGTVTLTGLTDATSYHWQAKVCDAAADCTAWSSYGGNAESATDFAVLTNQTPTAPSSLGPTSLVDGSYTTDNTPTFTFNLADPDLSDTVRYQILIDDTLDFSSLLVDYTSGLGSQGAYSFGVGQAAGTGTYTTGSAGQTLSDASYYWKVKTIDNNAASSAYTLANSGSVAFIIDTTAPSGPSSVTSSSHTTSTWSTDPTIDMGWTAATDGGSGLAGYYYVFDTSASTVPTALNTALGSGAVTVTSGTLSSGNSIYFHIRAVDTTGNLGTSVHSGPYYVDATAPSVPGTPTVTSSLGDTTPSWTWTASTDADSGLAATPYSVQWCQDVSFTGCAGNVDTSATNTYTHATALTAGNWYFKVKAADTLGNESAYSGSGLMTSDSTAPADISLDSPGGGSFTGSERPTFKWKTTTDAGGLARYDLNIDNPSITGQPAGDFSVSDIPISGTTDYETNKYFVRYENFSDADAGNDYISVYTKSSSEWSSDSSSGENDGKLREGKVTWTVKATDTSGNVTSASRLLFVDRHSPDLEISKINDVSYSGTSYSTNDSTPFISGKVTDNLFESVASGPDSVEVKIEKKGTLLYDLLSLHTINLDKTYYTCDGQPVTNNGDNRCAKYADFSFTAPNALINGTYRLTVTGRDEVGNSTSTVLSLIIGGTTTVTPTVTPIPETSTFLPTPTLEPEITPTPTTVTEVAVPVEPTGEPFLETFATNLFTSLNNTSIAFVNLFTGLFQNIGDGISSGLAFLGNSLEYLAGQFNFGSSPTTITEVTVPVEEPKENLTQNMIIASVTFLDNTKNAVLDTTGNIFLSIGSGIRSGLMALGTSLENIATRPNYKGMIVNIIGSAGKGLEDLSNSLGNSLINLGYSLTSEPTLISDVKVASITQTSAKVTWTTNTPATGKVNYGYQDGVYEFEMQTTDRTTLHEFVLTDLKPGTEYNFEVMSQDKNYVYDANRKFTTLE